MTDRCLQPTQRGVGLLFTRALTDRLAGKTGLKAGGMLTYAFNAQRYVCDVVRLHIFAAGAMPHSHTLHSSHILQAFNPFYFFKDGGIQHSSAFYRYGDQVCIQDPS